MQVKLFDGREILIDKDDAYLIQQRRWRVWKITGQDLSYVRAKKRIKKKDYTFLLHRVITNCPKGMVVDHINGNGLDNRRCNLRICLVKENVRNAFKKKKKFTSKYKGVCWKTRENKWWSTIIYNDHRYHLGFFHDEIDAAKAYNYAAKKYFKEFAKLNIFIDPEPEIVDEL